MVIKSFMESRSNYYEKWWKVNVKQHAWDKFVLDVVSGKKTGFCNRNNY